MSREHLAHLIHTQTAATLDLAGSISAHKAIRRVLRALAVEELALGQAIGILAETAERSDTQAWHALFQQAISDLRQLQASEP